MYIYGFRYEIIDGICMCVYEDSQLLSRIIKLGLNDIIKDLFNTVYMLNMTISFQRMIDIIPKLENVTIDSPVYFNTTSINKFNSTSLNTNNTDYDQGFIIILKL